MRLSSDPVADFEGLAADVMSALVAENRAHARLMQMLAKVHAEGERQRRVLSR